MWRLLRDRRLAGFNFRRQVPFQNYVLDFPCFDPEIVIEVDGSHHFESKRDKRRDSALAVEGFRTLSYWKMMCFNGRGPFWNVYLRIFPVAETDPSPGTLCAPPSPTRGEGKLRLVARHCS